MLQFGGTVLAAVIAASVPLLIARSQTGSKDPGTGGVHVSTPPARKHDRVAGPVRTTVPPVASTTAPTPAAPSSSPPPLVPPTETSPAAPDACKEGLVWRVVVPADHVCVTPETRDQIREDDEQKDLRVDPQGSFGPDSCIDGFVWREAVPDDHVCVTPERRDQAREDNDRAAERRR